MKRVKFLKSADGERIIRLRDVISARLIITENNGFTASKVVAVVRGESFPVVLDCEAAVSDTTEGRNLPSRARADMDRLLHLLNGGRLDKGEEWPQKEEV